MKPTKKAAGTASALAALGVGAAEQVVRMPVKAPAATKVVDPSPAPTRVQVSVQFSAEGMSLLRQAQARLLERGVPRATTKGVALEQVLREWLSREK